MKHIDLSHEVLAGMQTYPGLPVPRISEHLTRQASEEAYGAGVTFQIGLVALCTNTGTYMDVPFHRFADGHDLAGLDLARVAGVPAACIDRRGMTNIDLEDVRLDGLAGHAVLLHTGHADDWGTDAYFADHPHLTEATAERLVRAGVACVGIDSLNIDSTTDARRPVHTVLLRNSIPIIEHMTSLHALPAHGFTFTAVPPKIQGCGTFTVRAFASLRGGELGGP